MNLKYTIAVCTGICAAMLAGCGELDNYEAPDGAIHGIVVDEITGETVYQPVNSEAGLRVQLTQQDWEVEADPQLSYATEDGTFTNTLVFSGEYLMDFGQANFFATEKLPVSINGYTEVMVPVTPFCTIYLNDLTFENRAVRANVSIKRTWNWIPDNRGCKIDKIALFCHVSPHVDQETGNNIGSGNIDCSGTDDVQLLTGDKTFDVNLVMDGTKLQQNAHVIKANGNKLYVRAAVATKYNGDIRYNYSDIRSVVIE